MDAAAVVSDFVIPAILGPIVRQVTQQGRRRGNPIGGQGRLDVLQRHSGVASIEVAKDGSVLVAVVYLEEEVWQRAIPSGHYRELVVPKPS
jgi:hypothetical protein